VVSAVLHATWNYLLRRAGGSTTVVALSKVIEAAALIPFAAIVLHTSGVPAPATWWPAVIVAATLALANYGALTAAYRQGDLSLVYPIARGSVFLFLPLLGAIVFAERIGVRGWAALALIVGGILVLPVESLDRRGFGDMLQRLRSPAIGMALLAGASTAGYTIWDKRSVAQLDAFLYFTGYTVLLGAWFGAVLARTPRAEIMVQWRMHPVAIVMIGLLNAAAYMLILFALRDGMATQVLAVRQLSIPIGVVLGSTLLNERITPSRALGAAAVTAGCLCAAAI
jgi:drug/metabolite transporter (DMT)-like permease